MEPTRLWQLAAAHSSRLTDEQIALVIETKNMRPTFTKVISGVAWITLSPVALLMALISTVQSATVYNVHVVVFGAWTVLGVLSGIGTVVSASWARPVQSTLAWVALTYFAGGGILIVAYSAPLFLQSGMASLGVFIAAMFGLVVLTAVPLFYVSARRKRRDANEESAHTP